MVSSSHLGRLQQLHLLIPKEFHMGVIIQVLTSHNFEDVLLGCITHRKTILFNLLLKVVQSFKSLHSSQVAFKVALSFSGPHIANGAFGLAGASHALVFLLLSFFIAFSAVQWSMGCIDLVHAWHFFSKNVQFAKVRHAFRSADNHTSIQKNSRLQIVVCFTSEKWYL